MAICNVLVAFNGSPSSVTALNAALAMHAKYGAHVSGILAHDGQRERMSRKSWVPDNVRAILSSAIRADENQVEARFREVVGSSVPEHQLHWITLNDDPHRTLARYASMYDVTLVGRHSLEDGVEDLHPELIALKSGRPVLLIPRELDNASIHRRAVLAWDGQRASTRALNDAMQILETKQQVDVLSIGDGVRPPLDGIDVVTALSRHGIMAERIRRPQRTAIGKEILSYCDEVDAGLLVIGAHERSVFREDLFGGTTRHVLAHAQMPVLISH